MAKRKESALVKAIRDRVIKAYNQGETSLGLLETLASMGSGAIAEPTSGLAGLSVLALTGDPDKAAQAVRATQEGMTYQPRTVVGQGNLQGTGQIMQKYVGEPLERASRGFGDVTYDVTGSPVAASAAYSVPTGLLELIGAKGAGRYAKTGRQYEVGDIGGQSFGQKGAVGGVLYRGVSEGQKNKAGVTWATTDKSLAADYAGFRGGKGEVVEVGARIKSPFEAYHAEQLKSADDYIEDVIIQMDDKNRGFVDEALADHQIKKIKEKYKGSRQVNQYWLDPDIVAFMKNAGFDSIKSPEGGPKGPITFGIFEQN